MTSIIGRLIFCDGCGDNCAGDDRNHYTLKQMRDSRKKEGWIQQGTKDYCSKCKPKKTQQDDTPDEKGHAPWCNGTGTYQTTGGVFCSVCNNLLHR